MQFSPWSVLEKGLFFVGVALGLTGCGGGDSVGKISGNISYQGTPLKGGKISFIDSKGKVESAEIDKDGNYSVEKVAVGDAKIVVDTSSLKKRASRPSYSTPPGYKGAYKPPNTSDAAERYVPIPKKYEKHETTPLTFNVKRGIQVHPITLEGELETEPTNMTTPVPMNP